MNRRRALIDLDRQSDKRFLTWQQITRRDEEETRDLQWQARCL